MRHSSPPSAHWSKKVRCGNSCPTWFSYQGPVPVDPALVAEMVNMRFGQVGPGTAAKKRSMIANSRARPVITGISSGVKTRMTSQ